MRFGSAVVILLAVGAGQAAGQQPGRQTGSGFGEMARTPLKAETPFLTVVEDREGRPILLVDYPWETHARASVEVSSLPDDRAKRSEVRPLYFFDRFFQGEAKLAVYECQDASATAPTRATFSAAETRSEQETGPEEKPGSDKETGPEKEAGTGVKTRFDLLGDRNTLGRPAASVAARTQVEEITGVVHRAFFPLLAPWATGGRRLHLQLPPAYFAEPGAIRVWFLRGDAVIWSEDIAWPGYPE